MKKISIGLAQGRNFEGDLTMSLYSKMRCGSDTLSFAVEDMFAISPAVS